MKIFLGAIITVFVILFVINIADLNRYVVRRVAIYDSKIKKKMKICFLSDLHNCAVTDKFYQDMEEYAPDIILVGGDIITAQKGKNEKYAYSFMKRISDIAPVYFAFGNHEYRTRIYPETYPGMYDEFMVKVKEYGINVLSDDSAFFKENNICVTGVEIDRHFYKKFKKQKMDDGYIETLTGPFDTDCYNILLAHNPDYFDSYIKSNPDLVLSGHLHGGLIRLPFLNGVAHPGVRFFPKYSGGAYNEKGRFIHYADSYVSSNVDTIRLIVSCGIGFHTIPLRLFDPGELIFVTIDSK